MDRRIEAQGVPTTTAQSVLWGVSTILSTTVAFALDAVIFETALTPFFEGSLGVISEARPADPEAMLRNTKIFAAFLAAGALACYFLLRDSIVFPAVALWFTLGFFCLAADALFQMPFSGFPLISSIFDILSFVCSMAFVAGLLGAIWLAATDPRREGAQRWIAVAASLGLTVLFYLLSISFRLGSYLLSVEFSGGFYSFSGSFLLVMGVSLGNFIFALFVMVAPFIPLWRERAPSDANRRRRT